MKILNAQSNTIGLQELSTQEIECVSGGVVTGIIIGVISTFVAKGIEAASEATIQGYQNYVDEGNSIEHSIVW